MNQKKIFTTGLLTLLPLAIKIYVFFLVFTFLDNLLSGRLTLINTVLPRPV